MGFRWVGQTDSKEWHRPRINVAMRQLPQGFVLRMQRFFLRKILFEMESFSVSPTKK
jgi:hypothetical protein